MRTLLLFSVCLFSLLASTTYAREPMLDPKDMVAVELVTIALDPHSGTPVVLLREAQTGGVVPIFIGPEEARAIILALESIATPRPMTHDTAAAMMHAMGGRLERIMVDALVDNSYYGLLDIRLQDAPETPVYVDSRPSDALALAVRTGAAILVAPDVLQATRGREFEALDDERAVTALGITVSQASQSDRTNAGAPDDRGLLVLRAVGEALDKGIQVGSVIISVNDEEPSTPLDFLTLVQTTPAGESAIIRYWFEGDEFEVELNTDVPVPGQSTPPRDLGPRV